MSGSRTGMDEDLTKVAPPLIIKAGYFVSFASGVGRRYHRRATREKGTIMKVSIYKGPEGRLTALVQSTPGKGRAPVVLNDITAENVLEKVRPVVDAMRLPRGEAPSLPGLG